MRARTVYCPAGETELYRTDLKQVDKLAHEQILTLV